MVSVHSTYVQDNSHGSHSHHHQKSCRQRKRKTVIKDKDNPELLTRTSYVDASHAHREIKKVNKQHMYILLILHWRFAKFQSYLRRLI